MATRTLDAFQVARDPSRRKVLMLLSPDRMTINNQAEKLGMSRPAASKHIRILYRGGFISIQNVGWERHYTLKKDGFEKLRAGISHFDEFWASKMKKLKTLLNKNYPPKKPTK